MGSRLNRWRTNIHRPPNIHQPVAVNNLRPPVPKHRSRQSWKRLRCILRQPQRLLQLLPRRWHSMVASRQVNKTPANTAIFPWVAAGANGGIDIVYYGTSYYDGVNPPDSYPMKASWYVYFAQNLHATSPTSSLILTRASGIVHYGSVCES